MFRYVLRILAYLKPYKGLSALTILGIFLSSIGALIEPWPLKIIVDNVLSNQPLPDPWHQWFGWLEPQKVKFLIFLLLAGLAVMLLHNLFTILTNYWDTNLEQKVILDFRSDLFRHAQRLSLAYHAQRAVLSASRCSYRARLCCLL